MPVKYTAQQLKALATYSALVAKARAVTGAAEVTDKTIAVLARVAALSALGSGSELSVAVKASLLKADALTGHFFTLLELADESFVADLQHFDISKLRVDEVHAVEQALISLTKLLADEATLSDATKTLVGKAVSDQALTDDYKTVSTGKQILTDTSTTTNTDKSFSTDKSDTVSSIDATIKTAHKGLADEAFTQETFDRTVAFVRLFEDSVDGTDEINASLLMDDGEVFFLQKNIQDAATSETQLSYDIARVSSDLALTATDTTFDAEKVLFEQFFTATDTIVAVEKSLDSAFATETDTTKNTTKSLTSDAQTDVFLTFTTDKAVDSATALSDELSSYVDKNVLDAAQLTTDLTVEAEKVLADGATLSDLKYFDLSQVSSDAAATADELAHTFTKTLSDSVQVTDTQYFYFVLSASDSATTAEIVDIVRIAAGGVPPQFENQYATDQSALGVNKVFSDDISVTDDFDGTLTTEDDQTAKLDKAVVDPLTLIEVQNFDLQRTLSETLGANDSGYLFVTDYCDISYFSQSYVGQERIFT